MSNIANTPKPPYYAVIFTSLQTDDLEGYSETATRMVELAAVQTGYLGFESAREGLGIAVSYWSDLESIRRWKQSAEHVIAQNSGREQWYKKYTIRICRVERQYSMESEKSPPGKK